MKTFKNFIAEEKTNIDELVQQVFNRKCTIDYLSKANSFLTNATNSYGKPLPGNPSSVVQNTLRTITKDQTLNNKILSLSDEETDKFHKQYSALESMFNKLMKN